MNKPVYFDLQRKVVSHMVSDSWMNVPHVSYLYEPDVTEFFHAYQALSKEKMQQGHKLSFNTIILKVVIEGVKAAPRLNAFIAYDHQKGEGSLHVFDEINMAIPWVLPDGRMITPVIQNTEAMSLDELSDEVAKLGEKIANTHIDELLYSAVKQDTLKELKKFNLNIFRRILAAKVTFHGVTRGLRGSARDAYYLKPEAGRLTAQNLVSATLTVSNIGSLYKEQKGNFALLEIIPPQIFAVGVGAIQEKPGVYVGEDGQKQIGIRYFLPMCLTFDHRAVDFTALVPFLKKLDEVFDHAEEIKGW